MKSARSITALCVLLLASSLAVLAEKDESLQDLIAKAEAAHPKDRPALFIEVAERQLKAADELYNAGKSDEAKTCVDDVATYSGKAQDAALQSGSRLKQTEISLRKMAARLRDVARTLNYEDQAPVQTAADRLESLRTGLQKRMFGKSK